MPSLSASQRLGVNLAPAIEHYDPEPDVLVIDAGADVGCTEQVLTKPDDLLILPEFALRRTLTDLYRGTPLQPRHAGKR